MKELITFEDVLIVPKFSDVASRKNVDISVVFGKSKLTLPVISANMDTITGELMARTMLDYGAQACLHRFCSIEENVMTFYNSFSTKLSNRNSPMVSIGLGNKELERAKALFDAGAHTFVIDAAHGAQLAVVEQSKALREMIKDSGSIVVGNFASADSVKHFLEYFNNIDAIKVGIGPSGVCTTRIKTGVGYPQLSAIMEISSLLKNTAISVIADGGLKNAGDFAKAIGAGADLCMSGGMLSGTIETPGLIVSKDGQSVDQKLAINGVFPKSNYAKKYRGSASQESYNAQGKIGTHRTAEGESFLVSYKGSVKDILQDIEGGLRSSLSYVGAHTIKEFQARVEFVKVSGATMQENRAHRLDK